MSQMNFYDFEYAGKRKQTRRERFLAEMDERSSTSSIIRTLEGLPDCCILSVTKHIF